MESRAIQRTSSLNKNAAAKGTVGWLKTSTIQIRRSGFSNQPTRYEIRLAQC